MLYILLFPYLLYKQNVLHDTIFNRKYCWEREGEREQALHRINLPPKDERKCPSFKLQTLDFYLFSDT